MAIPSVMQGLIETEDGKVFELDSPKGATWLETIGSFRFEPSGDSKAYTVRKEPNGYWYGCRKIAGTVRKKYIGKLADVNIAKLEEIAKALEVAPAPVPRVKKVAEVVQEVPQNVEVAQKVAQEVEQVVQDRLTILELEVANLRKALEALQEKLPGKLEVGDSEELPTVAHTELHTELSNLRDEDESLRQELEAVRAENQRLQNDLGNLRENNAELRTDLAKEKENYQTLVIIGKVLNQQVEEARSQIETLKAENELLRNAQPSAEFELPGAFDVLNSLKAIPKYKDTKIGVVEAILRIIEESWHNQGD